MGDDVLGASSCRKIKKDANKLLISNYSRIALFRVIDVQMGLVDC